MSFIEPTDERWSRALAAAHHDVYATVGYVLADSETQGAEPSGFLVVEEDRVFLLPLLIRSVPTTAENVGTVLDAISPYGYPGIVLNDAGQTTPGFVDRCLTRLLAEARARDILSVFVRLHPWLNADLSSIVEHFDLTENGATVSIDLDRSEAEIWSVMRKGHTNAINQASRAGFEVTIGAPEPDFEALALVYQETLTRLGQSSSDASDIEHLRRFAALDEARVAVARMDGDVAGAYLFFEYQGIVQMHLGGTRTQYMHPSPSHLLIHAVALWAQGRGNYIVHLGGGVGARTTDSLFTFKSGFSPTRHPFRTLRLVSDARRYEQLVDARCQFLGTSRNVLSESGFFPAYRACSPDVSLGDG